MKVDLIDIKHRYLDEHKIILKSINRLLKKGNLILTEEVSSFEKRICDYTGMKYCLGLNSGTDALMMSLWALGVKKGDEVITTPISFIASIGAISHIGAKPVFVDIQDDLNIDPDKIRMAITPNTAAITRTLVLDNVLPKIIRVSVSPCDDIIYTIIIPN